MDVSSSLQHTVNLLVSSATDDPAECFIPPRPDQSPNGTTGSTTKQLSVEDNSFFIVKATGESLVLLSDYLKIVVNLELVVMDVMSRIIEFLKVSSNFSTKLHEADSPVFQLANMSGRTRRWGYALCRPEKHHSETSWYVLVWIAASSRG